LQSALDRVTEGRVEIEPLYADGLDGLDGLEDFSHIWLLTWLASLDEALPEPVLRRVPLLLRDNSRVFGTFATRGPGYPNPIGLSLVRLQGIDGTVLRFAGVDLLDGTVLLDIKPYVTKLDEPAQPVRCGWFDERLRDFDHNQGAERCD
jgi:tRNA (adenine37-N6)-methyltransferase